MPSSPAVPPTPDPAEATERFTVRCVEDLIALVPIVIGFEPEESLTLLSFAARPPGRTFHARVDLPQVRGADGLDGPDGPDGPPDRADLAELTRALSEPATRHRVSVAALVVHSARPTLAAATARAVARALTGPAPGGVRLVGCVRAHDGRWFRLPGPQDLCGPVPDDGVPYDVSLHPFLVRSVVAGQVLHPSRAALAATLEPDPAAVAEVGALAEVTGVAGDGSPAPDAEEEAWARQLVGEAQHRREPIAARDAARLLRGMRDVRVRDAAWSTMTRQTARAQVDLWRDLVRRTPDALLPAPGSLLAFAAWLAGDGALAWCALDRVQAVDPGYRLAGLVAATLEQACDPALWQPGAAFPGEPDTADGGSPGRVLSGPWPARPSSPGSDHG